MTWDPVAVSKMLRGSHGLDLEPSLYLDVPPSTEPGVYEVNVVGRMAYQPAGKRVVRWARDHWEVAQAKRGKVHEETDPLLRRSK